MKRMTRTTYIILFICIISFTLDYIFYIVNKINVVKIDKEKLIYPIKYIDLDKEIRYGYLNGNKNIVIKPKYLNAQLFRKDVAIVTNIRDYKGVINRKGEWILNPVYEDIDYTEEEIFIVKKDNKYGLVNYDGEALTKIRFDSFSSIRFTGHIMTFFENGEEVIVNNKGKIIKETKDDLGDFYNNFTYFKKSLKYGFIDINNNILKEPTYSSIIWNNFSNNNQKKILVPVKLGDKWGFVDKYGEIIIDFKYSEVMSFHEGFAAVKRFGRWGFINKEGKYLNLPIYKEVTSFYNGYACVSSGYESWSHINKSGKKMTDSTFYFSYLFYNGIANVKNGNGRMLINVKGNVLTKFMKYKKLKIRFSDQEENI